MTTVLCQVQAACDEHGNTAADVASPAIVAAAGVVATTVATTIGVGVPVVGITVVPAEQDKEGSSPTVHDKLESVAQPTDQALLRRSHVIVVVHDGDHAMTAKAGKLPCAQNEEQPERGNPPSIAATLIAAIASVRITAAVVAAPGKQARQAGSASTRQEICVQNRFNPETHRCIHTHAQHTWAACRWRTCRSRRGSCWSWSGHGHVALQHHHQQQRGTAGQGTSFQCNRRACEYCILQAATSAPHKHCHRTNTSRPSTY